MGLLDIFSRKRGGPLAKHAGRVANKRAQANDRWDSIVALAEMGTEEAVSALMVRFTYRIDPSITDQEEKDAVFQGVVAAGEAAVAPSLQALRAHKAIAWPLKCLKAVSGGGAVVDALLDLLSDMDVEYERDPEKKIQTLLTLEEWPDGRVMDAVSRFLDDVSEPARFHTVCTLLSQEKGGTTPADSVHELLLSQFVKEESGRVRARILDAFQEREWAIDEESVDAVRENLPTGYLIDRQRKVRCR